jgi:hypothetical protein
MATKNITPTNPDTQATDEVGEQDKTVDKTTMGSHFVGRRSARKTAQCKF